MQGVFYMNLEKTVNSLKQKGYQVSIFKKVLRPLNI